jgi:acyl-CoA synthetase (AMP-forming)/AMP-acid ligase II
MTLEQAIERTRVVDAGGVLEGSDLRRSAGALAASLAAAGLREGAVVALALDPARALLPALAAAWGAGATVVLVPPALGPAELRAVAAGLSPR